MIEPQTLKDLVTKQKIADELKEMNDWAIKRPRMEKRLEKLLFNNLMNGFRDAVIWYAADPELYAFVEYHKNALSGYKVEFCEGYGYRVTPIVDDFQTDYKSRTPPDDELSKLFAQLSQRDLKELAAQFDADVAKSRRKYGW